VTIRSTYQMTTRQTCCWMSYSQEFLVMTTSLDTWNRMNLCTHHQSQTWQSTVTLANVQWH